MADMKILGMAAAAALVMGAGHAAAATIVIDTFDTHQGVFDRPANSEGLPQGSEIAASEAIGGYRDLYVETDGTLVGDSALEVRDDPDAGGVLAFSNKDNVTGRAWVTYDGNDGDAQTVNTTGLGGLDLLDGAGAGFLFDVVRLDVGSLFVEIRAWDMFGEFTTFGGPVVEGGTPFAPLAAFSNPDFDWNRVGALQFFGESTGSISQDSAISSIHVDTGVIPLPASALLLLGGLGGLSLLRRKRS